jgi:hypothetical protein
LLVFSMLGVKKRARKLAARSMAFDSHNRFISRVNGLSTKKVKKMFKFC